MTPQYSNCYLSQALNALKQTFTLISKETTKLVDWDAIKDGKFYIINGQHTYAAMQIIFADLHILEKRKSELKKWGNGQIRPVPHFIQVQFAQCPHLGQSRVST